MNQDFLKLTNSLLDIAKHIVESCDNNSKIILTFEENKLKCDIKLIANKQEEGSISFQVSLFNMSLQLWAVAAGIELTEYQLATTKLSITKEEDKIITINTLDVDNQLSSIIGN